MSVERTHDIWVPQTFEHAYRFIKVLLERNGVPIQNVKHVYSEAQGCGFLYHDQISVVMFCPESLNMTSFIVPEVLDKAFVPVTTIIELPKKKVEISTTNMIDSTWKLFRTQYSRVKRWIIVSSDVNTFVNTLLLEALWNTQLTYTLQHFKYSELGDPRIITEHRFQPISVRIVPKAPTHLSRQILLYDIFARFYGLRVGQVIECRGYQSQSGEQVDYLQVAFSHSIKGNKSKPSKLPEQSRAGKKKQEAEEAEEAEEADEEVEEVEAEEAEEAEEDVDDVEEEEEDDDDEEESDESEQEPEQEQEQESSSESEETDSSSEESDDENEEEEEDES